MSSQIKILKKFLSLVDDKSTIFFNVGNRKSQVTRYRGDDCKFLDDLAIENNDGDPCPLFMLSSDNELEIAYCRAISIDQSDFQDFDDTSLVLKYGRVILDENIIQEWNDIQISKINPLSLSNFNEFLGL